MMTEDIEAGYFKGKPASDTRELSSFFDVDKKKGYDLTWSDVNMTLKSRSGEVQKEILSNVWGIAKAGKTTAIMGASGAGKTSLFSILSGRLKSKGSIKIEADIRLGGRSINPAFDPLVRSLFAFVEQEDALHEPSTTREALRFSAKLRLPKTASDTDIDTLVEHYIEELGLTSCADTMIGGGFKKGVSGGEKRRISIGVELISTPSIIFLDEPTSGLDSFAAKQVMSLLDKVAVGGATVLFTIHQPSSSVFRCFDHLIMLHKGRLMYEGETSSTPNDFAKHGYRVPENYNPADWIIEVAQSSTEKELETAGFFPDGEEIALESNDELNLRNRSDHVSMLTELSLLMKREKTSLINAPAPMIINVCLTGFLAVVFGVIFFGIGGDNRSSLLVIQGQLGAIVNILISTMMGQSQTALVVFSSEKALFLREYATKHYSIVPYFLSHLFTEATQSFCAVLVQAIIVYWMIGFQMHFHLFLAITYSLSMTSTAVSVLLGAFVSDMKSASALFTLVVVPQFYFSGVFVATNLIPSWVRWAQYICSLKYAAGLALIYEFGSCEEGDSQTNCEAILDQNNVSTGEVWSYWMAMIALFVVFRGMALLVLRNKANNFS